MKKQRQHQAENGIYCGGCPLDMLGIYDKQPPYIRGDPMSKIDLDALWKAVVGYFGADAGRIEHTRRVHGYACEILQSHPEADREVVEAAAMLHDIGIPEAERKHGSSAGPFQELEGGPIARDILERLGAPAAFSETVAAMVASHHSPGEIETIEFDILWDADWLVNLPRDQPELAGAERERTIKRIFHTTAGGALARGLGDGGGTEGIERSKR